MRNCFRLTPSRDSKGKLYLEDGLIAFRLGVWVNNQEVTAIAVNSGGQGRQGEDSLRTHSDSKSRAGSMEPIPEGLYAVGPAEFAAPNSFQVEWGPGLGPVWFDLSPLQRGSRGEFGIHLDSNREYAPGSAGCVVAKSLSDLKKIIELAKKYKIDLLVVDYGLGTVEKPNVENKINPKADAEDKSFKLFVNKNGLVIVIDGIEYEVYAETEGKLRKRKS